MCIRDRVSTDDWCKDAVFEVSQQEETMPNRVDNPGAGTRPEVARPGTQERAQQAEQTQPAEQPADRVEISQAAQQQARSEAPAQPERGAAQDAPSAQSESAPSAVNETTQNQAQQLREQQEAAQPPAENQQTGNLVDVTG